MPEKRPFDVDEVNAIFQYPWFAGCQSKNEIHATGTHRLSCMHYWAPLLALYTGCRAGEIGGLKLAEIMLDHQFPHIVIRDNEFRTTKKGYSRRVPILDVLISQGFAAFVEEKRRDGGVRLFEDWLPPRERADASSTAWSNGKLLRSFNRTVVPACLSDRLVAGARREVTFHSFRGAFKTMLLRKEWGVPTIYVNEIVGHAKDPLDQRYVKTVPISETYPAVQFCNYQGIILPSVGISTDKVVS